MLKYLLSCQTVRREACVCLRLFAEELPSAQMFPLKEKVIRTIGAALVCSNAEVIVQWVCVF
jgi:hypothetical protein